MGYKFNGNIHNKSMNTKSHAKKNGWLAWTFIIVVIVGAMMPPLSVGAFIVMMLLFTWKG